MKRNKWFLFVLVFCLTLSMWTMTAAAQGASKTAEVNGISITLETDKTDYQAGEEILFTLTIENDSTYYNLAGSDLSFTYSEGLELTEDSSVPSKIQAMKSGASKVITGKLVGNAEVFGTGSASQETAGSSDAPAAAEPENKGLDTSTVIMIVEAVIAVVIVLATVIISHNRKKKRKNKMFLLLLLLPAAGIAAMLCGIQPARAASGEASAAPYVYLNYAGQEVSLRASFNMTLTQKSLELEDSQKTTYNRVTCHDPSVFCDQDGQYYIFGSFLAAAQTSDLTDWTSIDAAFQASFTEEEREKIRAWNEELPGKAWNDYLWAPDVIYNEQMGKYCMYLSADGENWKSNIVLLTADKADGPYTYVDTIVYSGFTEDTYDQTDAARVTGEAAIPERYVTNGVKANNWGDKWPNAIDPCVFYDDNGNLWMSYGSWSGGIFMLELDEATGLRDYTVTYENDIHSDAYFGKKIAGGMYVSGEASYIQKIGDYYYLFVSNGNLEANGGYNMRVFRSENPDGDYVDLKGNSALYDTWVQNYNGGIGVRLMGGYKWRSMDLGNVAQGHNSAIVTEDGKAYVVFHTRTDNGTEGHYVKVHQLFTTKNGWIVAAPYQTNGETLKVDGYDRSELVGEYEVILHKLDIDYANLEVVLPDFVTLNEDGTISGEAEGTWSVEDGTAYIDLTIDGQNYTGVFLKMYVENTTVETMVFTGIGTENQLTIWGSKAID